MLGNLSSFVTVFVQSICLNNTLVSFAADKAKRFLAEFYIDGDEGKVFKYGEQLVCLIETWIYKIKT